MASQEMATPMLTPSLGGLLSPQETVIGAGGETVPPVVAPGHSLQLLDKVGRQIGIVMFSLAVG